jgi:hypothetical protein
LPNLFRTHPLGAALALEEDEAPDPVGESLFCPQAEVTQSGDGADAVEEPGHLHGLGVSGGKVLKAAGGQGHYTRAGAHCEEKCSAFTSPLRSWAASP